MIVNCLATNLSYENGKTETRRSPVSRVFSCVSREVSMVLRAPNIALFVIAGCLAMVGVLSAMPIELPIPGLTPANAAWYIFLAWFLLSAGSVVPDRRASPTPSSAQ